MATGGAVKLAEALVALAMVNVGPPTRVQLYVKASTAGEFVSALPAAERATELPAATVEGVAAAAAVGADTCSTFTVTEAAALT